MPERMSLEKRRDAEEDRAWLEQVVVQLQHRCAHGSLVVKLQDGQIARVELTDPRTEPPAVKVLMSPRHRRLLEAQAQRRTDAG